MCYFLGVKKVRDVILTRRQAIKAWKGFKRGFPMGRYCRYCSPTRGTDWAVGVPKRASRHGFYAVVRRPMPGMPASGGGSIVKRVLLYGRVREYDDGCQKHGYRAEFCVIPKPQKQKRVSKVLGET